MKIMRKIKVVALAALVGAAAAYLFDPQAGHRRRERLARTAERRRSDVEHFSESVDRVVDAVTPEPNIEPEPGIEPTIDLDAPIRPAGDITHTTLPGAPANT